MIAYQKDGKLHRLTMNGGENLIDAAFVELLSKYLDEIERGADTEAAVILSGQGKFFSNGLDRGALAGLSAEGLQAFSDALGRLVGRLLSFPVPTVAALNGHAFAGGAIVALACDYRVMREDRGWICFSEVDVNVPLTLGLSAMIRAKLAPQVARDAILLGKRFTGREALSAGFVDALAAEDDLSQAAAELIEVASLKQRAIFATLKARLWCDVSAALGYTSPYVAP